MNHIPIEKQLEVIKRGSVELVNEEELVAKLKKGRPLRIKAGFDPTAPDLHLGHTVVMQKLKQFQELGHKVIFLMGDFTARIGDPSGRNETRPELGEGIIRANAETYVAQAGKILDMGEAEIRYNSEWLGKFSAADFIRLSAKETVARMLERDDFESRFKGGSPIRIHEFLYPLLQGYDSVALEADVELGGTDQIFNLLVGRDLQRDVGQEPQVVLTMPLLVGTDGTQKMSKTYGNYVGISEPPKEIFGKMMSISDELMWTYYELLSDLSLGEIEGLKERVLTGALHPKVAKENLAAEIVERFHSEGDAVAARDEFERVFKKKDTPDEIDEHVLESMDAEVSLVDAMVDTRLVTSKSDARRMIKQRAVEVDGRRVEDIDATLSTDGESLVKVGKRRFAKVKFKK
ncbi:MAG: tyrosine--tRNA ligase [Proteobacteria bacterium]|nr:tyrosine--tRNA ligase [Pseudomonadota bacterium]